MNKIFFHFPLTLANQITIVRILLVPVFVGNVLYYNPDRDYFRFIALAIFLTAAILDVLDGYIARRYNQQTKAGTMLDPLADKLLLASAFITLYSVGVLFPSVHFPLWLVVTVISRDIILLIGALIVYLNNGDLVVKPDRLGKITVFLQVLCVVWILFQWKGEDVLWAATCFLTVASGLNYIRQGMGVLNHDL